MGESWRNHKAWLRCGCWCHGRRKRPRIHRNCLILILWFTWEVGSNEFLENTTVHVPAGSKYAIPSIWTALTSLKHKISKFTLIPFTIVGWQYWKIFILLLTWSCNHVLSCNDIRWFSVIPSEFQECENHIRTAPSDILNVGYTYTDRMKNANQLTRHLVDQIIPFVLRWYPLNGSDSWNHIETFVK